MDEKWLVKVVLMIAKGVRAHEKLIVENEWRDGVGE